MSDWNGEQGTHDDHGRHKRNDVRRAILGGVAGVALLVGPIALANSIIPDGDDDRVATEDTPSPSLIALRAARGNSQHDAAQMKSLLARQTTTTAPPPTTTAPPTTTTTAPPTTTTTEPPPPPSTEPPMTVPDTVPPPSSGQLGDPYYDGSWDALAECESGGNWSINTGNGYYGGIQFSLSTWQGLGGTGYPHEHSREVQIAMGKQLWESSGWGAWPACTSNLGWR
ncbi:MAG TPA: transglycosylase family protein [Acidimicrobiales bacterium]|nr:transglycosylase family protein [Acidimicrobiales bacterium]